MHLKGLLVWRLIVGVVVRAANYDNSSVNTCKPYPFYSPPIEMDLNKVLGIWYEYAIYHPPGVFINPTNYYDKIATVSGTPDAVAVNWTVTLYVQPQGLCSGFFENAVFSSSGLKNSLTYFVAAGANGPQQAFVSQIFTDYTVMEIDHRCLAPNLVTGTCDNPIFLINTRVKPPLLTQADINYIEGTFNRIMAPYCVSVANLTKSTWDLTLPTCIPEEPSHYKELIEFISKILTV
ncbi:hypothetical protein BV898_06493 [Hypsibius exemplaris]|uniref:Apolipoprotein D n=1 Tax=Hypsibius exemplaris TaxID=2072580 RepID=A0A1W0WWB9_HYPEX|nr:hypothetical protein BV898_06493 [Hypsibius exemplaris]